MDKDELLELESYEPHSNEELEDALNDIADKFNKTDILERRLIILYELRKRGEKK